MEALINGKPVLQRKIERLVFQGYNKKFVQILKILLHFTSLSKTKKAYLVFSPIFLYNKR